MDNPNLEQRLQKIESLLTFQKNVLTFEEGCNYCDFTTSHGYKLTSLRKIPFSKPDGKKIFFCREDLEKWLLRNPVKTQEEIDMEASTFVTLNRNKAKGGRVSC
jgi:Helix-turn-helix domain